MTSVRASGVPVFEVRYERLATDPDAVAADLAEALRAPEAPLAAALADAYGSSVGRYASDFQEGELDDVLAESGDLLRELGYLQDD